MEPERCAQCGFDATRLSHGDAITALRSLGRRWRELFKNVPVELLRKRPDPDTWSALEYAAHTRDVTGLMGSGMHHSLEGAEPIFPDVQPDDPDTDHGYNNLDPERVLDELAANADRMAGRARRALPEHWSRKVTLGEQEATADRLLFHAVHDATHHLKDVEKGLKDVGA